MTPFAVRGFNMCESLLRHSPEELRAFLRRMKTLEFNTVIIHYDYGWRHYHDLILKECAENKIAVTLMTFGPRTFFSLAGAGSRHFAKDECGVPFTEHPECETHPCFSDPEALALFCRGAEIWLKSLPAAVRHVHMRAGDGRLFCRCERCRKKNIQDLWQPFVAGFIRAAKKCRPDLKLETDVYYSRYDLPSDCSAHEELDRIMFDPFPRSPLYPLDGGKNAPETHRMLLEKLQAWCKRFPGKIYIHENAMKQGFFGIFQHGTDAALQDLKLFRSLGVAGVCYEAYEPGYRGFSGMFETLAQGLSGKVSAQPGDSVADWCCANGVLMWCNSVSHAPERFMAPGQDLEYAKLICEAHSGAIDASFYRRYANFVLENKKKFDWIYGCFTFARRGQLAGTLKFENLSPLALDFSCRKKLWDFLEDLPPGSDYPATVEKIVKELCSKAV